MKIMFATILLLSTSVSWCQTEYQPIFGDLLKRLITSCECHTADVWDYSINGLPHGIIQLRMSCVEILDDSLSVYLIGASPTADIPFLMAVGGYSGEYCFENFSVRYHEEENYFDLKFYIPGCARICGGYYRWNVGDQTLLQLSSYVDDSALEALAKADSFLIEGDIPEAIDELSSIQHMYSSYYYDIDEMIARLLRMVDRAALEKANTGNYRSAVEIFNHLFEFNQMSSHWYRSFSDSLDYMESRRSSYMSFSEYVTILNNFAFYLEQTNELFLSQRILRIVLDLQPSRTVGHLNYADVLWKLAEYNEASEHYSIYTEMMADSGLADQIPRRAHDRQTAEPSLSEHSIMTSTLSEYSCPVEAWYPIRIDSCQVLESGGIIVTTNRSSTVYATDEATRKDAWTITIEPDGSSISCEETYSEGSVVLNSHRYGDYREMIWLIARSDLGDTLWTCALEGTGEYSYPPEVTWLSDGGYMLISTYDCWSSSAWIARISSSGELLWHNFLSAEYLLDLQGGEVEPHVRSFRETSSGDVLACGSAAEWITDPFVSFVCLLDGETGDPIWKTIYSGMGQAAFYDAIETSSRMIVAVGATAESIRAEDGSNRWIWGERNPVIAVLDSAGAIKKLVVFDLDKAYEFRSIVETDPINNEFLIAGSLAGELMFLRMIIPTDQVEQGNIF